MVTAELRPAVNEEFIHPPPPEEEKKDDGELVELEMGEVEVEAPKPLSPPANEAESIQESDVSAVMQEKAAEKETTKAIEKETAKVAEKETAKVAQKETTKLSAVSVSSTSKPRSIWNGKVEAEVHQVQFIREPNAGALPRGMRMVLAFVRMPDDDDNFNIRSGTIDFRAMSELSKAMKKTGLTKGGESFLTDWRKAGRGAKQDTTTIALDCRLSSSTSSPSTPSSKAQKSNVDILSTQDLGVILGLVNKDDNRPKGRRSGKGNETEPFTAILPVAWTRLTFPGNKQEPKASSVVKLKMNVLEDLDRFPIIRIPTKTWDLTVLNPSSDYGFSPEFSSKGDVNFLDDSVNRKHSIKTDRDLLQFTSFRQATLYLNLKWTNKVTTEKSVKGVTLGHPALSTKTDEKSKGNGDGNEEDVPLNPIRAGTSKLDHATPTGSQGEKQTKKQDETDDNKSSSSRKPFIANAVVEQEREEEGIEMEKAPTPPRKSSETERKPHTPSRNVPQMERRPPIPPTPSRSSTEMERKPPTQSKNSSEMERKPTTQSKNRSEIERKPRTPSKNGADQGKDRISKSQRTSGEHASVSDAGSTNGSATHPPSPSNRSVQSREKGRVSKKNIQSLPNTRRSGGVSKSSQERNSRSSPAKKSPPKKSLRGSTPPPVPKKKPTGKDPAKDGRVKSSPKAPARTGSSMLSKLFRRSTSNENKESAGPSSADQEEDILKNIVDPFLSLPESPLNTTQDTSMESTGTEPTSPKDTIDNHSHGYSQSKVDVKTKRDESFDDENLSIATEGNVDRISGRGSERSVAIENRRRHRSVSPSYRELSRSRSSSLGRSGSFHSEYSGSRSSSVGISLGSSSRRSRVQASAQIDRTFGSVTSSSSARPAKPSKKTKEIAKSSSFFGKFVRRKNKKADSEPVPSIPSTDDQDYDREDETDNISILGVEIQDENPIPENDEPSNKSPEKLKHEKRSRSPGKEEEEPLENVLLMQMSWNEDRLELQEHKAPSPTPKSRSKKGGKGDNEPVVLDDEASTLDQLLNTLDDKQSSFFDYLDPRSQDGKEDKSTASSNPSAVTEIPDPGEVLMRDVYYSCGGRMVTDALFDMEWSAIFGGERTPQLTQDYTSDDESFSVHM